MSIASDGWTFRPRSRFLSTAMAWALIAGLVASRWVQGGPEAAARTLPAAVGLALAAWAVFFHPRVDVTDEGVRLVNPLRTIAVPWAALVHVETQYALTLVTPVGRFRAWAAPGPGRHQVVNSANGDLTGLPRTSFDTRGAVPIGDLPSAPSGQVAAQIRRRWEDLVENEVLELGVAEQTHVERTWNVPLLVLLAITAVFTLVVIVI
ncbi:PH domain-containing protein [Cellulomonas edaphi]|uniref:PH domain-containing protein n=1 Tax=Cellulomonas edaphi TaxID=3053468 RepID=A0ABT7S6X3_9CELL|nr:PH domain-containing protein [Cellulomons edaphi]MDM7830797.1 PH domain-containing protein [Cellulomons edaphi]